MTPIPTTCVAVGASLAAVLSGTGSFLTVRVVDAAMAEPALAATGFVEENGRASGPAYGTYAWPVHGPVLRGFEPPSGPYGPGHRGIDIGVPFGSSMGAAQDGSVAFAGWVGGSLFISIDHPDGVRTTYSWLSGVSVSEGDSVARGQVIGSTGQGHPAEATPHLHLGARVGDVYIDPLLLLEHGSVAGLIHLAPLDGQADERRRPAGGILAGPREWDWEAVPPIAAERGFRGQAVRGGPISVAPARTRGPPSGPAHLQ